MAERLSVLEVGLLTVAERRGAVRTARTVDQRNDPSGIERLIVLRKLAGRGCLAEQDEGGDDVAFVLTEAGRKLLAATDGARSPRR